MFYYIPKENKCHQQCIVNSGGEIKTLVNEEKPAGNYELEFDASRLPSGVYFYRVQATNFAETRKMVLMK